MISLPTITRANQVLAMALAYIAFSVVYLGADTVRIATPVTLLPSVVDQAIPFVAWSIWLYFTQFLLLPFAIVGARHDIDRSQTLYAMLIATMLAACVFVVWPTQVERLPSQGGNATQLAWQALLAVDARGNCFPSLHVGLACIAGRALWHRGWKIVALTWPALIALSTLTTRQHVAWDVVGGIVLAVFSVGLTLRIIRLERAQPTHDPASA